MFNIPLLADRLVDAVRWIDGQESIANLPLGFFGASTGAGAALVAAAKLPRRVGAVVSRGGRPDLAENALDMVQAPTLLIVGALILVSSNSMSKRWRACEGSRRWRLFPERAIYFPSPARSRP